MIPKATALDFTTDYSHITVAYGNVVDITVVDKTGDFKCHISKVHDTKIRQSNFFNFKRS